VFGLITYTVAPGAREVLAMMLPHGIPRVETMYANDVATGKTETLEYVPALKMRKVQDASVLS
jgi:hypothetical protein